VRSAYAWQSLPGWSIVPLYPVVDGLSRMIANIATSLGEEIGWRGLLVPLLAERYGFVATSLISGLIWGLWHFPLIFINQPVDRSTFVGAACFLIGLTGVSFPMTWLRLRSGSVWSAALFHAAHNSFNAIALALLTPSARTALLMDETGIVMVVVGVALAVIWSVGTRHGRPGVHLNAATPSNVTWRRPLRTGGRQPGCGE
jgi:membrane protease YdiL (CAAX protease family)